MREIKFRGANKYHQWYFGDLEYNKKYDIARIHTYNEYGEYDKQYVVCSETIGQYTGLKDKNGKEIYEGDIVDNSWCFTDKGIVCFGEYQHLDAQIGYKNGDMGFYIKHLGEAAGIIRPDILYFAANCEVVGNIYDNKELLDTFKKK